MSKTKKDRRIESEEELRIRERDDEIVPKHVKGKKHPHEILAPVGEEFIPEELDEQGFTEEGLGTPDNEDRANTHPNQGQRVA